MPLSRLCTSFMVEKFNFGWMREVMKYLGIKLSDDMDKIVALNCNPLLQKIKTTMWGKIIVIKMTVAPQFTYVDATNEDTTLHF